MEIYSRLLSLLFRSQEAVFTNCPLTAEHHCLHWCISVNVNSRRRRKNFKYISSEELPYPRQRNVRNIKQPRQITAVGLFDRAESICVCVCVLVFVAGIFTNLLKTNRSNGKKESGCDVADTHF